MRRVAAAGKPMQRQNVQAAILATHMQSLQGEISFDRNGDLQNKVISVYRVEHDPDHPVDAVAHQIKYIGVAPAE